MTRRSIAWGGWSLLLIACLIYALDALPYLFAPASELRLRPDPPSEEVALRVHAVGGLVALALGPWQFLPSLRRRLPRLHRFTGYGYVVGVAGGVVGAVVLARTPGGVGANAFAFYMLAISWSFSTAMALCHARLRRWDQHRNWMIRSFALTFAAVTLRAGMPVLGWLGFAPSQFYTIVAWASWTINLLVVEWLLLPLLGAGGPARAKPPT